MIRIIRPPPRQVPPVCPKPGQQAIAEQPMFLLLYHGVPLYRLLIFFQPDKILCVGRACNKYQHENLVNLKRERIQVDEIWSSCYAKQKNVPKEK
jgi:hypothetical protein